MENTSDSFMPGSLLFCMKSKKSVCYSVADNNIGKVKLTMQPQKKSLQKVWEWLEKYVAPSLKLFAEVGKIEQRDYIGNLVKNGEMNITQKQLYDDYIKARKLGERG